MMNRMNEIIPETKKESRILREVTGKRTKNTKYFATEDHGGIAAVYPQAVHYQDQGEWKEIDNTLITDTAEEGYQNKNAALKVRFAKDAGSGELVAVQKGKHRISWTFVPGRNKRTRAAASQFQIRKESREKPALLKASGEDVKSLNEEKMKVQNIQSGGYYEDIVPGIDLEYRLTGETLKENLVLKSKEVLNIPLVFTMKHEHMEVEVKDGELLIFAPENPEDIICHLSVPCMYDAKGIYSDKVHYELTKEEGRCTLTIATDQEWLESEERVFPITIDPNAETSKASKDIEDTFVREKMPGSSIVSTYGSFYVANNDGYGKCRAFLKFNNLPAIPKGSLIYDARMYVWQYKYSSYQDQGFYVTAHKVNGDWASGSTTWNSQPAYDSNVLDFAKMDQVQSGNTITITPKQFNITKLVREWYNTGLNHGIMLKMQDESIRAESVFVTSDYPMGTSLGITAEQFPSGVFYYRDAAGLEDYYSYHEQSVGRAGQGYINDFNGNLVFVHCDAKTSGNRMPAGLSHVYNLCQNDQWKRTGYGWRLSACQELKDSGIKDFPYVYVDADGTSHYFYKDTSDNNKLKDEDGLGLVITAVSSTNDLEYRTIETNKLIFGKDGYLRKEKDPNNNTITYTYASDAGGAYLSTITDPTGAVIQLKYIGGRLSEVVDQAGRSTKFDYDQWANLTTITYPDGRVTTYGYNNHDLIKAKAADGYEINYAYVQDFKVSRVSRITEKNGTALGQEMKISYRNGNTTVFEEAGLDGDINSTADNKINTYQFDHMGRPVCIYDQDGNAGSYAYFQDGMKNNKLSKQGSTQKTIINQLFNTRFEDGLGNWLVYSADKTQVQAVSGTGYIGSKSVKVTRTAVDSGGSGVQQNVDLSPGTYTASAYMKTSKIANGSAKILILGIKTDGSTVSLANSPGLTGTTDAAIDGGWMREQVTFTITSAYKGVAVIGALFNGTGSLWMTCFQLEEGSTANKFNIMENGSFEIVENPSDTVPKTFAGLSTNSAPWTDGRVYGTSKYGAYGLRIYGEIGKRKGFWKKIPLSGTEKEVFSVSGWAKGDCIPGKEFAMVIGFEYEDGKVKWENIPFNDNITDWQYVNKVISANDQLDDTNKKFKSLLFHVFFADNQNHVFFDGFQITRDDAESYVYDKDGNMISAKSAADKSGFSFDKNGNLSKMMDITGTSFEYGYDSKQNMKRAKSSEAVTYSFEYDAMGNPIRTIAQGGRHHVAVTSGRKYYIREKVSGKYLGSQNGATALTTAVEIREFSGNTAQKWLANDVGGGYFEFIPQNATGTALDIANAADNDGVKVDIYTRNQTDAQKFKVKLMDDGSYQIIAKCTKDKRCLTNAGNSTANGALITTWANNDTYDRQRWYFEPADEKVSDTPAAKNIYSIRSRHSGMYLDIANASSQKGAALTQYYYNGTKAQQFYLQDAGDGYFYMKPLHALNMALSRTGTYQGFAAITIQAFNAADDKQKFKFTASNGCYAITCKSSGEGMDVTGWSHVAGTQITTTGGAISSYGANKLFIMEYKGPGAEGSLTYTADGRNVQKITDSRGLVTTNTYDAKNRMLVKVTDARGISTNYSYETSTDRLSSVSMTVGGKAVKNTYTYDTGDRLKTIGHNGFNYTYEYDGFGNQTAVKIGSTAIERYTYLPHNGLLDKITYANKDVVENVYDEKFNLERQKYNGKIIYQNSFDDFGNIITQKDNVNNVTYRFQYDLIGRLTGMDTTQGQIFRVAYDSKNRVSTVTNRVSGSGTKVEYMYGESAQLKRPGIIYGIKVDGTQRASYAYDRLMRVASKTLNLDNKKTYVTKYTCQAGNASGKTTLLPAIITNGTQKLRYVYDVIGNIRTISENDVLKVTYTYDELNRLIREDNKWQNKTICYTYDLGGNMTFRKEYAYTAGTVGTVVKQVTYTYGNANWKDQLTAYNGQAITYDAIGNPNEWNGMSLTWQKGHELSTVVNKSKKTCKYYYDDTGSRIKKDVAGIISQFYYNGGAIIAMKTDTDMIYYTYDNHGKLFSMRLNGVNYYYIHNVQNDIIGLVDSAGNQVVSYQYDSWGRLLTIHDSTTAKVGTKNPFRYREYFWDEEIRLYYLNTRYYDPEVGRFLNPDNISVIKAGEIGYNDKNLYAYCDNNPIMRADEEGEFWNYLLGAGIGTLISAGYEIISQAINNGGFKDINWKKVGVAALSGAIGGTLAAGGLSVGYQALWSAVNSLDVYLVNQKIDKKAITVQGAVTSAAVGTVGGVVGGSGSRYAGGPIRKNSFGKALEIQKRYAATGDPSYNGITQAIKNARPGVIKQGTWDTLKSGGVSFFSSIGKTVVNFVKKTAGKAKKWFQKHFW